MNSLTISNTGLEKETGTGTGNGTGTVTTALVGLAILLVYLPCLFCPLVLDDRRLITENPYMGSLDSVLELFVEPVTARLGNEQVTNSFYRPLTFASLYIDRLAWGDSPAGFHLTSLLLHLANTALLFRLLERLLRRTGAATVSRAPGRVEPASVSRLPLVLALFWAILPLQVETVVYVAARHDLLATFFYLLALDLNIARSGWSRRAALFICGALCFLAKETAFTLPLAAAAYDLCLRPGGIRERLKDLCWPLILLLGFLGAHRVLCGAVSAAVDPLLVGNTGWHYLGILFSPFSYSVDRSADASRDLLPAVLFFCLVAAVALFTLRGFRKHPAFPAAVFALLWTGFSYLPVSNLVPLYSFCADRYLYLPLAALTVLVGLHLTRRPTSPSRLFSGYRPVWIAGALMTLGCNTFLRANFFTSEEALYRISLQTSPKSSLLTNNLAWIELERGNLPQAEKLLEKSLESSPSYHEALFNLGRLRSRQGNFSEAMRLFRSAADVRPDDADSWYQLGLSALALKQPHDARDHLLRAARLRENHLGTLYHLAVALHTSSDSAQAKELLRHLVRSFPNHAGSALLLAEIETSGEANDP